MRKTKIYTVGHSTHSLEYFLELLKAYDINCIVDVRSIPASQYNPQFNQAPLSRFLKKENMLYLHFPEEFGARHQTPSVLDEEGKVDFEKFRQTDSFKKGIERLIKGVEKGYTIALMCSEAEPFDCHRFSMISVFLAQNGFEVLHILKDKTLKINAELEEQLLKKYNKKLPVPTIFEPDITAEQQLEFAYRLRNKDIAYSPYAKIEFEEEQL
jgi:uncharacterized protein (DUF488 family)